MVAWAKTSQILLIVTLLFGIAGAVFGGGVQEDPLEAAGRLIEEKQYNDAILILSEVMQTDPRRFDEAQDMLNEIKTARSNYNEKYEELIDIYKQDELDLDKAYQIFEELENMDKSPNKSTVEAFERAKATAVFVYNKKQFESIMAEALALLQEDKYWEAAATYLDGFDLYLKEFQEKAYGNIIETAVAGAREGLTDVVRGFEATRGAITNFFSQAAGFIQEDDTGGLRAAFDSYYSTVKTIAEGRKEAFFYAEYLREQNAEIESQYGEEEFHLSYLYLLTMGRRETEETEGIIGAVDLFYDDYIDSLSGELTAAFTRKFEEGRAAYAESGPEGGNELFRLARPYGEMLEDNYMLWQTRMYVDDSYNLSDEEYALTAERLPEFTLVQTRLGMIRSYESIGDEVLRLRELYTSIGGMEEEPAVRDSREQISADRSNLNDELAVWRQEEERTRGIDEAMTEDYSPAVEEAAAMVQSLAGYVRFAVETEQKAVERIASIRYAPLISRYEENTAVTEEGVSELEGFEETVGEGEAAATITRRNPEEAKNKFDRVAGSLDSLRNDFAEVLAFIRGQDEFILESPEVQGEIDLGTEYIRRIDSLETRLADLAAAAQEQILLAARYEEEGYYRINQARIELQRESFEEAREELRLAGERFDLSLSVQDDPALREERDTLIANLSDEINTTQNNVIVAEVRELIETAKNYYTQEQYDLAERNLLRAQSRWSITHVDTKPEIDYWLQIVRVALYVQSGRVIEETDPLFAEMSQLLNLARENYLDGKQLAERGQQEEANRLFEEAEKNILYVKIPFPLNKEASVLSLRILQYKNPGEFEELFRKKFNEALAQINTNPQQAYIDLKDLETIRPNYPGIQNAIYRTEIELGMRIPPPDPEKQRQADQLYARALQIVQGGVRAQFPIALEYLNEALKLTPQNQQLTTLLDRVEAEIGGRTTTVLSNEAQQQYRLAEEKYIGGNYYEALRIVNILLKDRESSQYPPLLELKRRIESKI